MPMIQDVFMCSLYFFIPLRRISKHYIRSKNVIFQDKGLPAFVKKGEVECQFAEISFDHNEELFSYTYNIPDGTKEITRDIKLKAFLLRYNNKRKGYCHPSKKAMELLMIGTSIDKIFPPDSASPQQSFHDRICTVDDLVLLKLAFVSNDYGQLVQAGTYQTFNKWLTNLVSEIEVHKERAFKTPLHSIVDVKGFAIETTDINDKHLLDLRFTEKYYSTIVTSVSQALQVRYSQFIYGLLFGNEHYYKVPDEELNHVMKDAYSNNTSEIIVAAPKTIVFLHTLYPFRKKAGCTVELETGFSEMLDDVSNIYEICEIIHAERKIKLLQQSLQLSSASNIMQALLNISQYMEKEYFHLVEMDRKMDYLFEAIGFNRQFRALREMTEMAAKSADIKVVHQLNRLMLVIALVSAVLALLQFCHTITHQ